MIYTALLALTGAAILFGLSSRATADINVLHDRNPLFVTLSDGSIRNGYTIKILNKTREAKSYELALHGLEGATLTVMGEDASGERTMLAAKPDSVTTYRAHVTAPREALDGELSADLEMVLTDATSGAQAAYETIFRGPEA